MDKLKSMNGSQFDTAYMKHMVEGHETAVSKFKSEEELAKWSVSVDFAGGVRRALLLMTNPQPRLMYRSPVQDRRTGH